MRTDHQDTRTVLVVDDNPAIVALLHTIFVAEGYRVLTALAREAVQYAREWQPAVILLDISMPELDGVQVCERLRAEPATAAIPVIALSAQLNLHLHGGAMGADAYVAKPFDVQALVDTVATWADRQSEHEAHNAHNAHNAHDNQRLTALQAPAPARGGLRERLAMGAPVTP